MIDFKQYFNLDGNKITINFNGKEFKINKSYKITLYLEQKTKEINKMAEEDKVRANFDFMFECFNMILGKEFIEELETTDIDEISLMKLFQIVMNIKSGMTEEEAIKDVEKEDKETNKKK